MKQKRTTTGNHWNAYWSASDAARAAVTGDAPGDLFDLQWRAFFEAALSGRDRARLIDLACGAGVVLERAINASQGFNNGLFYGLDYSSAAAAVINAKSFSANARASGVAASAADVPFSDQSFDLVFSQFGLEYAGRGAFPEAARILAPGGQGLLIIHYKSGGIYAECAENLQILDAILDAELFESGRNLFSDSPEEAEKALAQNIAGLRRDRIGPARSARTTLEQLTSDLSRIAMRRGNFDRAEILRWLAAMEEEIFSYRDRMKTMTDSALDEAAIQKVIPLMSAQGVEVAEPEALTPDGAKRPAAAWRIEFKRSA